MKNSLQKYLLIACSHMPIKGVALRAVIKLNNINTASGGGPRSEST